MSIEKIKENHEKFKNTNDSIEKLRIAARNAVIQLKSANKLMEEVKNVAETLGYDINEDTGELI